jgi:hypothetical protein
MPDSPDTLPRRGSRPARALRNPLRGLLVLVGLIGVAWALLVPPWQSPDEIWHFAYAQSLEARHAFPDAKRPNSFSTAQSAAVNAVGASQLPFYADEVRPNWSHSDFNAYLARVRRGLSDSDGGGTNTESSNPPLFYVWDDLPLLATSGSNALTALYAMRLWNVVLLLVATAGGWLLAGEVFGRRRWAQLLCGSVVGLIPMQTFMLTSVNPDALMIALWTLALWMGARVINRRAPVGDAAIACGLTAAAILTKATSYALVPAIVFAVIAGWLRRPPVTRRAAAGPLALAGGTLVVPVLGWIAAARALGHPVVNAINAAPGVTPSAFRVTQLLSYVWQFYLPRLPFMTQLKTTPGLHLYEIWVREGWGVFGYLDVAMPSWLYGVLAGVSAVITAAGLALLARVRRRLSWIRIAYLALAGLSLMLLLHVSDYRSIIAGRGQLVQGRYLLPVISLAGLAAALVIGRLSPRWRGPACGALLAGLMLVQLLALSTVATRYYA